MKLKPIQWRKYSSSMFIMYKRYWQIPGWVFWDVLGLQHESPSAFPVQTRQHEEWIQYALRCWDGTFGKVHLGDPHLTCYPHPGNTRQNRRIMRSICCNPPFGVVQKGGIPVYQNCHFDERSWKLISDEGWQTMGLWRTQFLGKPILVGDLYLSSVKNPLENHGKSVIIPSIR